MKKKISLAVMIIAISIIAFGTVSVSAETVHSGRCGDNLTWTLDDEQTLTISGNGDMFDYESSFDKPWFSYTIRKVIVEHGVTSIGFGAFMNESVESIKIADSVISIGAEAFYQCCELKSINIPDSVENIGEDCFFNSGIEKIKIGSGVKYIGEWAFANAHYLKNITVSSNNEYFSSDEFGVLFNKDKTIILRYPEAKTDAFYEIPKNVQEIANPTFRDARYLTNIVIPDSVKIISDYAFARCSGLEEVQLPGNVKSIGNAAFFGCTSLKNITIPVSVTNIGDNAFSNCTNLTDVYYNGTETEWNKISLGLYNESLTNATIHFIPNTKTTLSNNDKTFNITPLNIENGETVILALYNGEQVVEVQSVVYIGELITCTTDKTYTKAKVMVWDDLTTLTPVCEPEIIK